MRSSFVLSAVFAAITPAILADQIPLLPTGDSCTINSGASGECMEVSTCRSQGGVPEAGHCPGAANIQCCTFGTAPSPTCPPPDLNSESISRLKGYEGFVPDVRPDPVNLPSIGYGHKCKLPGCAEVTYPIPLSEEDATSLMLDDLKTFQFCIVEKLGSLSFTDNQYGALASFTYNEGCASLQTSTLARRLLAGEDKNTVVEQEFPRWVFAGRPPRVLPILVNRRNDEIRLFELESDVLVLPIEC